MKCNRIMIDKETNAFFDTYLLNDHIPQNRKKRPLIIVCPGGAYNHLSVREGEPVALAFCNNGYHAIVLNYTVGVEAAMPKPLYDLANTVKIIRERSDEWNVDKNKIHICGFSAGGHLAASLGVYWNNHDMMKDLDIDDYEVIKPNGLILSYPVIDLKSTINKSKTDFKQGEEKDFTLLHPKLQYDDIFENDGDRVLLNYELLMNTYICGQYPTSELLKKYSLQNHVSKETPATFIWHGGEDKSIFPRNSILFANALDVHEVNYELHIFGKGGHGISLANEQTASKENDIVEECQQWINLALKWLGNLCNK